jgi:hypothetical protein
MSITAVTGKPGSGKSYHVVNDKVLGTLKNWASYERKKGEKFPRMLYHNLTLNLEAIEKEVNLFKKKKIDIRNYVCELQEHEVGEFWRHTPDDCLIIVDELHQQWSSIDSKKEIKEFIDYTSLHRHRGHDVIMITQSLENVPTQVKLMAESIEDVVNAKMHRIPKLNIPIGDILQLASAFDIEYQVYKVRYGSTVNRSLKWEDGSAIHWMKADGFKLYQSYAQHGDHGGDFKAVGGGDRSEHLTGKADAVWWFSKNHLPPLLGKIALCAFVIWGAFSVITGLGGVALAGIKKQNKTAVLDKPKGKTTEEMKREEARAKLSDKDLIIELQKEVEGYQVTIEKLRGMINSEKSQRVKLEKQISDMEVDKVMVCIIKGAIVLRDGLRVNVGDSFIHKGKNVKLSSVDASKGVALLSSGGRLYLR